MKLSNSTYTGSAGRKSLIDLEIPEKFNGELILFVHGFMGFKDWGAWNLVQQYFTGKNYGFCKFNLNHGVGARAFKLQDNTFAKHGVSDALAKTEAGVFASVIHGLAIGRLGKWAFDAHRAGDRRF